MQILINGRPHEVAEQATVADALTVLGAPSTGVAVAVDDELVPRTDWARYRLAADARVEVLTAVQGG
jgi:sulfur carrier protein